MVFDRADVVVMAFEPVAFTRNFHDSEEVMPETVITTDVVPVTVTIVEVDHVVPPSDEPSTT